MKKVICILLAAVMIFSLAACAQKDVSGLGSLNMNDSSSEPKKSGGVGRLGEPSDPTSAPKDEEPEPEQQSVLVKQPEVVKPTVPKKEEP